MRMQTNILHHGDALDILKTLPCNSIHSVVTDPPYGLSYRNLKWDAEVPGVILWKEVLRVLKPGGYLLAFTGSRTYHRMAMNIEEAGFEIRDQIIWLYGSGFPKSHDIGKALARNKDYADHAQQWKGWGTTLKPAHEPIVVARKPFRGSVTANVLKIGTGGLNVDACRVGTETRVSSYIDHSGIKRSTVTTGRFPANLIHDGFPENWAPYFYCAKPSKKERDLGLEQAKKKPCPNKSGEDRCRQIAGQSGITGSSKNCHPTVKPLALMEYLVRLVTPPKGIVLDPFAGSGTTLIAAKKSGFLYVGIEREGEYLWMATSRLNSAELQ